jgi:hypothetical protein
VPDPGLLDRIGDYLSDVMGRWQGIVAGLFFLLRLAPNVIPSSKGIVERINHPRIFLTLALLFFVVANFMVYDKDRRDIRASDGSLAASTHGSDARWKRLDPSQIVALTRRIIALQPHNIMVACESINCLDLSDDLVDALVKGGWNVTLHHGGGLGVSGVTGLVVDQDGAAAQSLKEAVESITGLKVSVSPLPKGYPDPSEISFVVGIKPF